MKHYGDITKLNGYEFPIAVTKVHFPEVDDESVQ